MTILNTRNSVEPFKSSALDYGSLACSSAFRCLIYVRVQSIHYCYYRCIANSPTPLKEVSGANLPYTRLILDCGAKVMAGETLAAALAELGQIDLDVVPAPVEATL